MIPWDIYFRIDPLSLFIGAFVLLFFILTVVYSEGYRHEKKHDGRYYVYVILTFLASWGAVFANHLILFLVFWGFLGLMLYLLIGFGEKPNTPATAKKALIIVGGADALMILGVALMRNLAPSLRMDETHLTLTSRSAVLAFLCLASGAFAKAGAMPFHSWIPDTAEDAPASVAAYLPAALDKLLGIYFLVRISLDLFQMTPAMNTFLLAIGSFTIVAAVMMALVQHDLKRLLGYHAVSQVGYMVLGIGTGNPVGIAGGLFHMLNNTIYKTCLFQGAGAVEEAAGTTDLDRLGGLGRSMPATFASVLIASLAISGVPPLNGFASKWMIYQGVIELGRTGSRLWPVWLVAAMFGSALTLASFMKVIHAVFLGQPSRDREGKTVKEVGSAMWVPMVFLAALCILFGVLAVRLPLTLFVFPSLPFSVPFAGVWSPGLAAALLATALGVGFVIFWLGRSAKVRETESFVGGETVSENPDMRVSGTEFYLTIQELGRLKGIYNLALQKRFDPYDISRRCTSRVTVALQELHHGVLLTYLAWCLLGACVLFYVLLLR